MCVTVDVTCGCCGPTYGQILCHVIDVSSAESANAYQIASLITVLEICILPLLITCVVKTPSAAAARLPV
jgi:hypothetical protein